MDAWWLTINMREAFLQYASLNAFFVSNPFISNDRLKLAKNQANAQQHPKAELLTFESY